MVEFSRPLTEVVEQRYSCRTYLEQPIAEEQRAALAHFLAENQAGPFGTRSRLEVVAAGEQDRRALKGLGTYGFIKGATGFVVGATREGPGHLEDFGYLVECAVLYATDLGLGTCWLGGSFTKSRFAQKIGAEDGESVPAVVSVGYEAKKPRWLDGVIRRGAGAERRLPWDRLFFVDRFDRPLDREQSGAYQVPLEMVRLGPSASNKQPWRIVQAGAGWHFYLQRTRGYREGNASRFMRLADMQRIDMGIAMSHFALVAEEIGLAGHWLTDDPGISLPDDLTQYLVSWVVNGSQSA